MKVLLSENVWDAKTFSGSERLVGFSARDRKSPPLHSAGLCQIYSINNNCFPTGELSFGTFL